MARRFGLRMSDDTLTLADLVTARAFDDRPFIVSWSEAGSSTISFRQYATRVDSAVSSLARCSVSCGERVGVLSHNSVEFWTHSMAIVCKGAVCVLLNHRQPPAIIAATASAAGVTRLLTAPPLLEVAREVLQRSPNVEPPLLLIAHEQGANDDADVVALPATHASPERRGMRFEGWPRLEPLAPAVCFFTSGSTSTPKPVVHSHSTLLWARESETAWLRRLGLLGSTPRLEHTNEQRDEPEEQHRDGMEGQRQDGTEGWRGNTVERRGDAEPQGEGLLSFGPGFHVLGFCMSFLEALHAGVRFVDDARCHVRQMSYLALSDCFRLLPMASDGFRWLPMASISIRVLPIPLDVF